MQWFGMPIIVVLLALLISNKSASLALLSNGAVTGYRQREGVLAVTFHQALRGTEANSFRRGVAPI